MTWLAAIAAGATAGAELPAWLHLEFLITLYLVGEIVSKARQQPRTLRTVIAASVVTLLTLGAPLHLGTAVEEDQ